jgi:hypothetical protein
MRNRWQWLAVAPIAGLLCLEVLGAPAAEAANPTATPSWGGANLISYADSDFETGVADWQADTNTTVSGDTSTAFLHSESLKAVAGTSGSQSVKLGSGAGQINVAPGDTYRVSSWFKAPAVSGRTITWAMAFYTASGTWIGWTSGSADTLNASGNWQYASALIKAPANAAYDWGGPRVTEAGVSAGEALHLDEVMVEPYRAATLIGAEDPSGDGTEFSQANAAIGPLQADKIFYDSSHDLPTSYSASSCANLPSTVTCLISYKIMTTNVVSFVRSIPTGQPVIMTYWQEPENDAFSYDGLTGGPAFVAEFENQSSLIRSAGDYPNVLVAMDSMDYQYDAGSSSHNLGGAPSACSFIPPASYVDIYLADHYEFTASGGDLPSDAGSSAEWDGWLGCVQPQDKPIGIAEYGLNCGQKNGVGAEPNALTTSEGMAADNSYLESQPDGLPVVMWEYWWDTNGDPSGNCQFTTGGSPDGTQAAAQWQANETQNGGGA